MRAIIVPLAIFGLLGVAYAAELPRYDVEGHCNEVASVSGGSSMIKNSCMDMEQSAYNALKVKWSSTSEKIKAHCNDVARVTGGSYTILQSCIEMEESAESSPRKFKY